MMLIFPSIPTFLLSFFSFIVLMTAIFIKCNSYHSNTKKTLPPSPPKLPIIGNLHQLGSNPNQSLEVLSRKYGPLMLLQLGSIRTLVVSSSEAAQQIMKTHDLSFSSRPTLAIPSILLYGAQDIAFAPYGEYWRQMKSMAVVHILSNTRVKTFRTVREQEVGRMIGELEESCGSLVDMGSLLISLSSNIISSVTVGRKYDGLVLEDLLKKFMNSFTIFSLGNFFPWLRWIDQLCGLERRANKVAKEFDEFLDNVIEQHVDKKRLVEPESDEGQDFVDILLDVQRDNTINFSLHKDALKAIILDMFAAGSDTTFTSLHWTISEVIKHPRVMKKLQREVTEIANGKTLILEDDLENMHYLKAVLKESLRLHGPFPLLLPRKSTQDVELNGYDIPAGTQVIINAWAIGRDPALWEEPQEFRPERFLNNSIDYNGQNFHLIPFGAGRRKCPGIHFAVSVMELALANIVYKFDLALPNGAKAEDLNMREKFGITLHMKSSLMVVASPRF